MIDIRWAKNSEIPRLKEIWRLCFGDPEGFIDLYFGKRFKEQDTLLLLCNGEIASMLTVIPVKTVFPGNRSIVSVMLYAVGTDPRYRNHGFSAQLINFCYEHLFSREIGLFMLVPAGERLFDFYRKLGYRKFFFVREDFLSGQMIENLPVHESLSGILRPAEPEEYNRCRNNLLQKLPGTYIAYSDEEIRFQKIISRNSGSDIFTINFKDTVGCAVIERTDFRKAIVKELLVPTNYLPAAVKEIAGSFPANEYLIRTPLGLGERPGGAIRAFGMIRINAQAGLSSGKADFDKKLEEPGYLGIAFD